MEKTNASYDVLVCGGGPAGIGAAIAASRSGAKTLLIEQQFALGGIATGAYICNFMDTFYDPILKELVEEMINIGASEKNYNPLVHHKPGRVKFHPETLKAILIKTVLASGCDVLMGTIAEDAQIEGDTVRGVYMANKDGRTLFTSKVTIDTTADGGIAASAGAEFMKGDTSDGRLQHVNFKFNTDGIDWEKFETQKPSNEKLAEIFSTAVNKNIITPPRGAFNPAPKSFPFHISEARLALSKWEIEKVDPSDAFQISNTMAECQIAAFQIMEFCRKNLPGFENSKIARFPSVLGTRESRRIKGKYILTGNDVIIGRKFGDGIARASFFIDFHDSPPGKTIPYSNEYKLTHRPSPGDWYDIPYRCLLPEKIKGLLIAGRCISADREGLASTRVMPTCFYTGTAAGIAASISVKKNILPDEVPASEVRKKIDGLNKKFLQKYNEEKESEI
ncbi:MAG: hypothetical protein A2017_18985 [Lentisphaerae bacterium GWF2_44_16]|nr:MAG: hypothetical protein A2017_18985 [Lentisphaerae bacterium GWF2_44_16]